MKCPLVFACDSGYAVQLATTLRSIAESNARALPLACYVLSSGFSRATMDKIAESLPEGSANIEWLPVDTSQFRSFSTLVHVTPMTYARFLIPKLLPERVSRVLYLDVDILVLDDLEALWESELEGAVLGAVADKVLDADMKGSSASDAGMPLVERYFNAGVLLIDLSRWRKERVSERALEYLREHPRSPYSDQDALNVACDGSWKQLEERWNYQEHGRRSIAAMSRSEWPAIVHFASRRKPWRASSKSPNAGFYDEFRGRTRFARTQQDRWLDAWDVFQDGWYRTKRSLKRQPALRAVWQVIRRVSRRPDENA